MTPSRSILYSAVFLTSAGVFFVRLGLWTSVERKIAQLESARRGAATGNASSANGPDSKLIQGMLGEAAKKIGVKRLLNVGLNSSGHDLRIKLEWEAAPEVSHRFLSAMQQQGRLGRCEDLHVTAGPSDSLRVAGVFESGSGHEKSTDLPRSTETHKSPIWFARNVFRPLWTSSVEDPAIIQVRAFQKREAAEKQEEVKKAREERERAEKEQADSKKRQLENEWMLTGIVNNGKEALAFLSSRTGGGQTLMVRSGDALQEARVVSIDERRGEIQLDYQGKFQVNLKISGSTGQP